MLSLRILGAFCYDIKIIYTLVRLEEVFTSGELTWLFLNDWELDLLHQKGKAKSNIILCNMLDDHEMNDLNLTLL